MGEQLTLPSGEIALFLVVIVTEHEGFVRVRSELGAAALDQLAATLQAAAQIRVHLLQVSDVLIIALIRQGKLLGSRIAGLNPCE